MENSQEVEVIEVAESAPITEEVVNGEVSNEVVETPKVEVDEEPEWFKKRIDKMTARNYAEQQRANEASLRAENIEREFNEFKRSMTPEPNFYEMTEEERVKHVVRKEQQEQYSKQAQAQKAQADYAKDIASYNERVARFKAETPDFDQAFNDAEDAGLRIPSSIQAQILKSDVGAEIAYHLVKSPLDVMKLQNMDERARDRYLLKLELKFESARESKPKVEPKKSNAPSPTPKQGASVVVDATKPPSDPEAYRRYKDEQRKKQAQKR